VLWNLENPLLTAHFDRVIHMDNGKIVSDQSPSQGRPDDLGNSGDERERLKISA
jgi:hypothetical protein